MIVRDLYKKYIKEQTPIFLMGKERQRSINAGKLPPLEEAAKFFHVCTCGCSHGIKADTPSKAELELANRAHRLKPVRRIQNKLFQSLMDKVTEAEVDLLALLQLPDIEIVRRSIDDEDLTVPGRFSFSTDQAKGVERIFSEWQFDIIGTRKIQKQADEEDELNLPIYQFFMLQAYAVELDRVQRRIQSQFVTTGIQNTFLPPNIDNRFLASVTRFGEDRIKEKMGKDFKALTKQLRKFGKEGANPMTVARFLHKTIGEGQAWRWNRIARSEPVLSLNAAFDAQSEASRVIFEEWSAAIDACVICQAFDGRVWRRSQGPQPVTSTHPHCLCIRIPLYNTDKPVQSAWDRATPYDRPFTRNETSNLVNFLNEDIGRIAI